MPQKLPPVTRQQLMQQLVTKADAFTALRFLRHRETVGTIIELEAKGEPSLPGMAGVLADTFYSLWEPEPEVKEEVPPNRRYFQTLFGQAMQSSAYGELHALTQLDNLKSVLGTVSFGEAVLSMIPKKDQEKLKQTEQAQAEANEQADQANAAEAEANAAEQIAQAAQAQAAAMQGQAGQPGNASGQQAGGNTSHMTAAEAQALADQLAEQAAEAKAKAEAAKQNAAETQAQAEAMASELLGEPNSQQAEAKLEELARIGQAALKKANHKVQEVSDTIQAWGVNENELTMKPIPETLGLLERMKRNESFKRFSALLGRIKKIAARKAAQISSGETEVIETTEYGNNLAMAERSEIIALLHPALRFNAMLRWMRSELAQVGQIVREVLGRGPVIAMLDISGSMDGDKEQFGKASVLGLAHFAKLQARTFGWITFDSVVKISRVFKQGIISAKEMLEIAEASSGGGTDFERPLRKAMEMVVKDGLKKADLTMITDGMCGLSKEFVREFLEFKKRYGVVFIVVLCDVGETTDASLKEIADRIERASTFTADEAGKAIFNHLI